MAEQSPFFVDSSVLIKHLRQTTSPTVFDTAVQTYGSAIASDMVVFELEIGARRVGREFDFHKAFPDIETYPLTQAILIQAAIIHVELLKQNAMIGLGDTFIAATAVIHKLPLYTLNVKHFSRVAGITILSQI